MISPRFLQKKRILLVIAHPDDEAMFFGPLLLATQGCKSVVSILCISTGNADGIGELRRQELLDSADFFGIDRSLVDIIDHNSLQDGFNRQWPIALVSSIVVKKIESFDPDMIVTFDEGGVSGHPNHISTYRGVLTAAALFQGGRRVFLKLESTNICRKFLGVFDILITLCFYAGNCTVINLNILLSVLSMKQHYSQLVWYRLIFILFSRYTYINTFQRISSSQPT